jgi:hypothetical protein
MYVFTRNFWVEIWKSTHHKTTIEAKKHQRMVVFLKVHFTLGVVTGMHGSYCILQKCLHRNHYYIRERYVTLGGEGDSLDQSNTIMDTIRQLSEVVTSMHDSMTHTEPVFLNVYGAQESTPRNEFRQIM